MANLIDHFDPGLKGLEYYSMASLIVYKVEKDGKPYIIKIADLRSEGGERGAHHLNAEKNGLMIAHDIRGITHLVHDYGAKEGYSAILKEYFDGTLICDLGERLKDAGLLGKIESTIDALHNKGLAGLDVGVHNIAISPDRKDACIIELGSCITKDYMSQNLFDKIKMKDWHDLREKVINDYFF